jgi:hypothetical protein
MNTVFVRLAMHTVLEMDCKWKDGFTLAQFVHSDLAILIPQALKI